MAQMESSDPSRAAGPGVFATTHWSVVLAAGRGDAPQAQASLEKLCQTYWLPLYAYVRRQGHSPADAQDFTQEFFARLLQKDYLPNVVAGGATPTSVNGGRELQKVGDEQYLLFPLAGQTTPAAAVARLAQRLEDYLRGHTEILLD